MDLSVVIVNYNVRYFLELALLSVERAIQPLNAEVWLVDNNSHDGSVAMVRERFPWVKLIVNDHNPGFSVANNQAIRRARGRYVLLLNPDTVVGERTFSRCLRYADARPDLGGLGVRMIDGSGNFLPESKRGLPTPWVAFTKAFGLARLFPRSPRFNRYHLGYLDQDENHPVEILSGAYMWMRRSVLEEVGLLDEDFFMYGEDIDLSYRITQGGYTNHYFALTTVVHYKGESTKRGSLNYVRVFYQAMIIFARKHFVGSQATALVALMQAAVYLRASLTVLANVWRVLKFPLLDAVGMYAGLVVLKHLWAGYHFGEPDYFPDHIDYVHFPAYVLLWTGGTFLGGGYDRPYDLGRTLRGLGVATLLVFSVYGLLPEDLRPSRALLLLGAAWAAVWTMGLRVTDHLFRFGRWPGGGAHDQRLLIVGSRGETERALSLLEQAGVARSYLGRVASQQREQDDRTVGHHRDLADLVAVYRATEVIFCAADLPYARILGAMRTLRDGLTYRILTPGTDSIVGSHRSDRRGRLYTVNVTYALNQPGPRRNKWLFDRAAALLGLLLSPLLLFFVANKGQYFGRCLSVLTGRRTWVGYAGDRTPVADLPRLRPGVYDPLAGRAVTDPGVVRQANFLYARDYTVGSDWRLLWGALRRG